MNFNLSDSKEFLLCYTASQPLLSIPVSGDYLFSPRFSLFCSAVFTSALTLIPTCNFSGEKSLKAKCLSVSQDALFSHFCNLWLLSCQSAWLNSTKVYSDPAIIVNSVADGDCSHEIKRCLLLGRKVTTNLDDMCKSRNITLPTKVHLVKAMVFQVVMHGCEIWTVKKAECRRIDAFELWCWRRLLRVPWTSRRSNQSILKEISPGCSLEGLMLKLKLQYFGHLIWRADSLEKTLMLGGIGGRRRKGQQRMRWLVSLTWWTCVWVNSGSWWWTRRPGVLWFTGLHRVRYD